MTTMAEIRTALSESAALDRHDWLDQVAGRPRRKSLLHPYATPQEAVQAALLADAPLPEVVWDPDRLDLSPLWQTVWSCIAGRYAESGGTTHAGWLWDWTLVWQAATLYAEIIDRIGADQDRLVDLLSHQMVLSAREEAAAKWLAATPDRIAARAERAATILAAARAEDQRRLAGGEDPEMIGGPPTMGWAIWRVLCEEWAALITLILREPTYQE